MQNAPWISPLLSPSDYTQAGQFAASPWPILVQGETGVGKDYLARWLHENSLCKEGPFVPVNCGALPITLMESELFGFERGAFTGAHTTSLGLIRAAEQGTLFLDEVAELDLHAQAKLLRFLDTGEVRSLSSRRTYRPQVRVLAATHVDLVQAVRSGRFRLDLFERLSVLSLRIPPLRQKRHLIEPIAEKLLFAQQFSWEPEVLSLLTPYPWPGNIRQLRNILLRAGLLGRGKVCKQVLESVLEEQDWAWESGAAAPELSQSERSKLWEIEKDVVRTRLRKFGGNKKATAEDLGIAKSTLHDMLRRWKKSADDLDCFGLGMLLPSSRGDCATPLVS